MDKINMFDDTMREFIILSKVVTIIFFSVSLILLLIRLFYDTLFLIVLGSIMLFVALILLYEHLSIKASYGRSIILSNNCIQVLNYNNKILYEININFIVETKKIEVLFYKERHWEKYECIVFFMEKVELENLPEYRSYWNDRKYLFIQNRNGVEDILKKYMDLIMN